MLRHIPSNLSVTTTASVNDDDGFPGEGAGKFPRGRRAVGREEEEFDTEVGQRK